MRTTTHIKSEVAECPFSNACSCRYRKLNSAASWNCFWNFFTNIEEDLIHHNIIHAPNAYILKTSTQQKLYKEFLFDILKTQCLKFHYCFPGCVSQFCEDQVLVLNWECLHRDESIVSLLSLAVSVCSLLKSRKFCLKNRTKQKSLVPQSLQKRALWAGVKNRMDFPHKPTRGLWKCKNKLVAHCNCLSREAAPILQLPELHPLVKCFSSNQQKKELKYILYQELDSHRVMWL